MRNFLFVIVLVAFSAAAHADKVWECVNAQGSHTYQNQPCVDNPQAEPVHGYEAKPKYSNNPPVTGLEPVTPGHAAGRAEVVAAFQKTLPGGQSFSGSGAAQPGVMLGGIPFSSFAPLLLLVAIGVAIKAATGSKKRPVRNRRVTKELDGIFGSSLDLGVAKPSAGERKVEPVATASLSPSHFVRGRFLSPHEIEMFKLLLDVVPAGWHVFTQVSLGQMLQATGGNKFENDGLRFKIAQKAADFVICLPDMSIALVVELDDVTHLGKEDKDNERDAFLLQAGIPTKRYFHVPPMDHLREFIAAFSRAAASTQ